MNNKYKVIITYIYKYNVPSFNWVVDYALQKQVLSHFKFLTLLICSL